MRFSDRMAKTALYGSLLCCSAVFMLPLLWMVSTSLKTDPQVYRVPPVWIPNPMRFRNYPEALNFVPFGLYFRNTLKYVVPYVLGSVASATLVGYSFSKIAWRGRDTLFFICISAMMIPYQVTMIPLYIVFKNLRWLGTYLPLVIPAFFGIPYDIFLLRQFFLTIPEELSDAARIDGCSELGVLLRIIVPLSKPALAVVALFRFIGSWNDYLRPLIYLAREEQFPVSMGLDQFRAVRARGFPLMWPYLMAASVVITLPVIVLFFLTQRTFVEGVALTGIKG